MRRAVTQLLAGRSAGCSTSGTPLVARHWTSTWTQQHGGVDARDVHAANQELNLAFGISEQQAEPGARSRDEPAPHGVGPSSSRPPLVAGLDVHTPPHAARHSPPPPPPPPAGQAEAAARLTHVDERGWANMVDVSGKAPTRRSARASCLVLLGPVAYPLVEQNRVGKGNVLSTAQLAGIMAAKQTSTLIPLCHNIPLSKVSVDLELDAGRHAVQVSATAVTVSNTGVEMEALTAASVAALTVYDMCKAASKAIEITSLRLEHKDGGKSGDFSRAP